MKEKWTRKINEENNGKREGKQKIEITRNDPLYLILVYTITFLRGRVRIPITYMILKAEFTNKLSKNQIKNWKLISDKLTNFDRNYHFLKISKQNGLNEKNWRKKQKQKFEQFLISFRA